MKLFCMILTTVVALAFTTTVGAADNAKLLVGKWQVEKVDEGTLPKGAMVEFKADKKFAITMKKGEADATMNGTYVVEGDAFIISMEGKDSTYKITIKKISETDMETANPEGKNVWFKKVK